MEEKHQALIELAQLQGRVFELFTAAESAKASRDYVAARTIYGEYVDENRHYLNLSLEFNRRFTDLSFHQDIPPIARPLTNALLVYADILAALGYREEAEKCRTEALLVSEQHLGEQGRADAERSLAGTLILQGRFNEALVSLQRARTLFLEERDALAVARVTIDYADVLQWLGDFERAEAAIVEAEQLIAPYRKDREPSMQNVFDELMKEFGRIASGEAKTGSAEQAADLHRAAVEVTFYHGLIAKALEKYDVAENCFTTVHSNYAQLGAGEAIMFQMAAIKVKQGRAGEALAELAVLAPTFEGGAYRAKRGAFLRLQAECFESLGDIDTAIRSAEESVADLTNNHFDPDLLWRSQGLVARLYAQRSDNGRALVAFAEAIETVKILRRAPLGYRLDSTYLRDKQELFDEAIGLAITSGAYLDACDMMDSIKSRTLTAVLGIPASTDTVGDSLGAQFEAVTQELDMLEFQGYREGWDRARLTEQRNLLQQRSDLLENIRISDPRWRTLSEPLRFEPSALLAALTERRQAALSLHYSPPNLYAVLLVDGSAVGETLTISSETAEKLEDYSHNLQKEKPDLFKHDLSGSEYGIEANDILPEALLERALQADSLMIVPHSLLHLVPWAGLLHKGKRLFEYLPVGISPNLNLLAIKRGTARPQQAAVVAVPEYQGNLPDLTSAREEVEAVSRLYSRVQGPLVGPDATEAAFWDLVRNAGDGAGILHVSCHGTLVPREPMNGGLLMFDGKIDAAEVARSQMPFKEVVLSACSTGWRPFRVDDLELKSDEVLGIPAGFLEAGAETILVSIPKAEGKSARDLTVAYHKERSAGAPPLIAFQRAQLGMLKRHSEPAAWLGFTLYGCV